MWFGMEINWLNLLAWSPLYIVAFITIAIFYFGIFWISTTEDLDWLKDKKECVTRVIIAHVLGIFIMWGIWGACHLLNHENTNIITKEQLR